MDNHEMLRGALITTDIGTVGAGLSGPDQFEAFYALAQEKVDFLGRLGRHMTKSKSGSIPRITFADNLIESAPEAADTGNYFEPTHDTVPFTLTKARFAAKVSNDTLTFAENGAGYEDTLMTEAAKAWGRALLRLAWQGDTTSLDTSLNINQGFAAQIAASGNVVTGGGINGGTFVTAHLDAALQALDEAHAENLDSYGWIMTKLKFLALSEHLSNRATGMGDDVLVRGSDGILRLKGFPIHINGYAGSSTVYLADPSELVLVADRSDFSLKKVEGGQFAMDDAFGLVSFLWADFIIKDVAGTVVIDTLV